MKKIKEAVLNLYDIEDRSKTDVEKIERVTNELIGRVYYMPTDLNVLGGLKFRVLTNADNKSWVFPVVTNTDGKMYCPTFLSENDFKEWEEQQGDKAVRPRGALIINFVTLLEFLHNIMNNDPRIFGVVINVADKDNIVLDKNLMELLYEKVKSNTPHVFISESAIKDEDREAAVKEIHDMSNNALSQLRAAYWLPSNLQQKQDILMLDCPRMVFQLYGLYIYKALEKFSINEKNLIVMFMYGEHPYKELCNDKTEVYCRDEVVESNIMLS